MTFCCEMINRVDSNPIPLVYSFYTLKTVLYFTVPLCGKKVTPFPLVTNFHLIPCSPRQTILPLVHLKTVIWTIHRLGKQQLVELPPDPESYSSTFLPLVLPILLCYG